MKLSIPDMSCGHCQASVTAALAPFAAGVTVDLPARQVTVPGASDTAAMIAALAAIGFPAQMLAE